MIGAGISGLAAAHAAAEASNGSAEIVVLEREPEVGGKARTILNDGWTVEAGPTGFLLPDPAIERLVRAAGLESELLPSDEAAAHRFLVRGGRMREVAAHPAKFIASGILGPFGILRLLREPWVGPRPAGDDESVWEFAERRLGRQAADRLVAPMVLGVFAGDARRLSVAAAFPRLKELEAEHGSLVRGMIASGRRARAEREARASAQDDNGDSSTAASASSGSDGVGGRGKLTSFRRGLETLPRTLAARGRAVVRCGTAVERIDRGPNGELLVRLPGETIRADAVILACEAFAASRMVSDLASDLAADLAPIQYPPVAVVGVGYEAAAARGVPRGFGVLVPRDEGCRVLGVLWESYIFSDRSPDHHILLRAMLGGAVDPDAGAADPETLLAWTRADLRRLLGIESAPRFTHVHRWERAIPQYEIGHGERVRRIESAVARRPGLYLAGNALHGVAFGKAAAAGLEAGAAAAAFVARRARDSAPA